VFSATAISGFPLIRLGNFPRQGKTATRFGDWQLLIRTRPVTPVHKAVNKLCGDAE
jgi:hypothetical protein